MRCSGRGALYRQTVLLSSFASAEMNALLGRCCRNHAGRVRLLPAHRGVLGEVVPQVRQVFERLPAAAAASGSGAATDADARFEHFKRVLWPRLRESGRSGGHLVYIPSYFDYVRCWGGNAWRKGGGGG
jgi:U3 small nucleolar RNA-associated protein 25